MIRKVQSNMEKLKTARYHHIQKKLARKALRQVESLKGKIPPQTKRRCAEYAKEVLGWQGYAPWLRLYSAVAGSFKEGWIPDNYYGKVVVPRLQGGYGSVSHLKAFNSQLFGHSRFPDLAYQVNGFFISKDYQVISAERLQQLLYDQRDEVVFKKDHSFQGSGVYFMEKNRFEKKKIKSLGNGVFQEVITQHPFFGNMMPSSVATLRLTTVCDHQGAVSLRAAYLRVGRSADSHVRSASHIRIPVELGSGALYGEGYLPNWTTTDRHPDTQVPFAGKTLPAFSECVATAIELHQKMPLSQCIGWDLIPDENGKVKVMEWNGTDNDIKFSEATQGPGFADLGWEQLWRGDLDGRP